MMLNDKRNEKHLEYYIISIQTNITYYSRFSRQ